MDNGFNNQDMNDQNAHNTQGTQNGFEQPADGYTQAAQPQNPAMQYNQMQSQSTEKACGFAIAGMVLGILSIVCCCAWYISIIMAILGFIFSVIVLVKKKPGRGMAIAGVICSVIGLLIAIGVVIFAFAIGAGAGTTDYEEIIRSIQSME